MSLLGDKILEVNGFSLARVTHSEAVDLFRRTTGPKCHLLVQRLIFPEIIHVQHQQIIFIHLPDHVLNLNR